ncbi:hypothetical protein [Limosilactobacillus pontis]|uniref:Phage tail protein n=1 Tax=Limosilactobacillus pontis TaxID=35787 RepID=A0ABU7SV26_9LACO
MIIYKFDDNGFYQGTKEAPEDYQVGAYETTIAPAFKPNGHSTFDGSTWHDLSETAYMQANPAPKDEKRIIPPISPLPQPTQEQKMIAKLGADVAQTQQMIAKLATIVKPQGGQANE